MFFTQLWLSSKWGWQKEQLLMAQKVSDVIKYTFFLKPRYTYACLITIKLLQYVCICNTGLCFSLFLYRRLKMLKNCLHALSFFAYFYKMFGHFFVRRFCMIQYHLMHCCFKICTMKLFSKRINIGYYTNEWKQW